MIGIDSCVWIDYFNGIDTPQTAVLDELLGVEPLAIGDLIQPRSGKDFARMAISERLNGC